MNYNIRKALPNDARLLIDYVNELASEPNICLPLSPGEFKYTEEQEIQMINDHLTSDNTIFLIAEVEREIVGVLNCDGGKKKATRHCATLGISVKKEYRQKGIGKALMNYAIDWAKASKIITRIELIVYKRNTSAIKMYENLGFVPEGIRKNAISNGTVFEDELSMAILL